MNLLNFNNYNKEAELSGGDYWKFLDATKESLKANKIDFYHIRSIINEITNSDLKSKMKEKIYSLIEELGICFNGIHHALGIFDTEEIRVLLEKEFSARVLKEISENERYYDIFKFIDSLRIVNDPTWEYKMLTNILSAVKNYNNMPLLINIVEYIKKRKPKIYEKLILEYYSYFPEAYKNYLKMREDPEYVFKRSLQFTDEDIGIDSRIKIAPEIEANIDYTYRLELDNQIGCERYCVVSESTVPNGSEIKPTRPFHNVKEDISIFCGLCEAMKDVGYYYNEKNGNAAGQINLGLDYLDTKEAILNFYEIYGNCEKLLYYICHEEGQLFRQNVYFNSRIKAISRIIGKRILDEDLSRQDVIELFNSKLDGNDDTIEGLKYKKNSVCLRGDNETDYRLEFRVPNGGCNYRTWIDNIRLFGKMMEVAKRIADMMQKDYLSDREQELLKLKISLEDRTLTMEEKLAILLDLLFEDNEIKKIYYNRYKSTLKKIKETKSTNYNSPGIKDSSFDDKDSSFDDKDPSFGDVEFVGQFHSAFERDYNGSGLVITYDPESDTINYNRKSR